MAMSAETTTTIMTIGARNTRRSPFASGNRNTARIKDYLQENLDVSDSNNIRYMKQQSYVSQYVPSFEGFLSLGFSIHIPCDHTMKDCKPSIDDFSQGRMESLVMLFLCSQHVEMVVSTAPTTLLHLCPFNNYDDDIDSTSATSLARTISSEQIRSGENPGEPMMLWNLPRLDTTTIVFDDSGETTTIIDMATNTTFTKKDGPQQYYTQLNFTYPVYQWGDEDPSITQALQDQFDDRVVSTGTLNSLLPWPNAIAAPTGDEPYVFWNEPLPIPLGTYDTTIPVDVGIILQCAGGILIFANTLFCILLAMAARCTKRRKEKHFRRGLGDSGKKGIQSDYLDTEAGVAAILMESKHYALSKSEAFASGTSLTLAQHNNNNGVDRNITGVEVDLKMADQHTNPHLHQHQKHQHHYDHLHQPKHAGQKEDMLLARVKHQQVTTARSLTSTPWYSGKKLLSSGDGNAGDDYDDEEAEDLQILNLASPRRHSSGGKNLDLSF